VTNPTDHNPEPLVVRAEQLTADRFFHDFLEPNRPVVVRGALASWGATPPWDLATLDARFGSHPVPLYDTLFSLQRVATFSDYVAAHTGTATTGVPPYLRWFAKQSNDRMPWADKAFAELSGEWAMPSWLPDADYLFPRTRGTVDAATHAFPAKGIFVCGTEGRTRLHVDPWASDACLCQVTGSKRFRMYPPSSGALLSDRTGVVNPDEPDDARFPRWRDAVPVIDEVLHPGDAIFIPAGWFHSAVALTDSVSITWNFVHEVHEKRFSAYLRSGGTADPIVTYFRGRSPRV
jgi:hypothetical protein